MSVRDYRDLIAWQKSVDFIEEIYRLTRSFPKEEQFGMVTQMRRAAVSVSANIAEGSSRATSRDYLNFISQARGSLREVESLVLVSKRLHFATAEECVRSTDLADEISRILSGLRAAIAKKNKRVAI